MMHSAPSRLPVYLALAYLGLIVYASLYPLANWRDSGLPLLYFLDANWPRYWTVFDLAVNVLAYLPLGFLLSLSFAGLGRWLAAFLATLAGVFLSFGMECLQDWIPSRVPSNLDLLTNSLGTLAGVVLALRYGEGFFVCLVRRQEELIAPVPRLEIGLLLVGLWFLTQLSPETLLFGNGDLYSLFGLPRRLPYEAQAFFAFETGIIACHTLAIGLFVRALLADRKQIFSVLALFFAAAVLVRTLASAVLVDPLHALDWLTPGSGLGLLLGGTLLFLALLLPAAWRMALAGLAILVGSLLVNLIPHNPYSALAMNVWRQGHFLNFNGLTKLVSSLWPFMALPYLIRLTRQS